MRLLQPPKSQESIGPCIVSNLQYRRRRRLGRTAPNQRSNKASINQPRHTCYFDREILADATTLGAFEGGTPPDNPGGISSLACDGGDTTSGIRLLRMERLLSVQLRRIRCRIAWVILSISTSVTPGTVSAVPTVGMNVTTAGRPTVTMATYAPEKWCKRYKSISG